MTLENYCKKCGHRIVPGEPSCTGCGRKTGYLSKKGDHIFTPPIHNIGFFNFDIDFSPYIERERDDYKYEICSCGYINNIDNEYCYMCGAKRVESKLHRILKKQSKPKFSMDTVLCECGSVNHKDNVFCEMCGRKLKEDYTQSSDNYSNFNREFNDSVFCFCGEENERFSQFCRNCGLPLINYGQMRDVSILCTCSTINEGSSSFCTECGANLKQENSVIVCVCGYKNPVHSKFCRECERPLNPQRTIKSKIICSCGEILEWGTEFCPNCAKNSKNILRLYNRTQIFTNFVHTRTIIEKQNYERRKRD